MREIKFRAWDRLQKKMFIITRLIWQLSDNGLVLAAIKYGGFPSLIISNYILMQFAGRHDKNGKEIYKGDIIKCLMDYTYIQGKRVNRYITVEVKSGCPCHVFPSGILLIDDIHQAEVIGNVHEKPELLTQEIDK